MRSNEVLVRYLGSPGESRLAVVNTLASKGVIVHPQSVPEFRTGRHPGTMVDYRLRCSHFLEEGTPANKISFYLTLGQQGVGVREPQDRRPDRFAPQGFTKSLAAKLGIQPVNLGRFLRAIRADIVFADLTSPDQQTREAFLAVANSFLDAFTIPSNARTPKGPKGIADTWNGLTIEGFYRVLYGHTSKKGISIWEPFEAEFIQYYYQQRQGKSVGLSPFDILALKSMATVRTIKERAALAREQTGIPVDQEVLAYHVRALVNPFVAT